MDTQALHSNTVKFNVPYDRVHDLRKDLRRWHIRHYPFRRQEGGMEVEMYSNPKNDFILLKYSY
jgi:hypothetical protein